MKHDGWALKGPKGLMPQTYGLTKDDAWAAGYSILSERHAWILQLWKQWEASIREARKRGYVLVRVKLREVK